MLQDANCVFILLECTERKNLFFERKLTIISSNHLVKHCYNRASKFVSSSLIARACFIFLLSMLMTSANVSLEKKIFHRVENVIKQLVHTSAVRSSRYEARGKFREHERCKRVARGVAESYSSVFSYASFVLSKLHACFISR